MLTKAKTNTWSVPRDWHDETCFIVCGGESFRSLDKSRLRGRRVVVINSSFMAVPDADYLIFSDRRWWNEWSAAVKSTFCGEVVTLTPMSPSADYLLLDRQRSSGLSLLPSRLASWHTTVTAATNLVVHLGVRQINYLALDGHGDWHHAPHKWKQVRNKFKFHALALEALVDPLRCLGIEAFNANADSSHKMFPHKPFEDM